MYTPGIVKLLGNEAFKKMTGGCIALIFYFIILKVRQKYEAQA